MSVSPFVHYIAPVLCPSSVTHMYNTFVIAHSTLNGLQHITETASSLLMEGFVKQESFEFEMNQ